MSTAPFPISPLDVVNIIRSYLAPLDLDLTPEGEAALAREFNGRLIADLTAKRITVNDTDGNPICKAIDGQAVEITVAEHMAELAKIRPALFRRTVQAETKVNPFAAGSMNITRQHQLMRENPAAAARMKAEAAKASGAANPWTKAGWNLTQQMALTIRDPEQAAKLKAEAGR